MGSTAAIVKLVVIFFVVIAAVMASLMAFGAMTMDTLTESLGRIAIVSGIAIVASLLVSFISSFGDSK